MTRPQDFRYSRQTRFAPLGEVGQARIRSATVAIVGCGALGSVAAEILARAGVGRLLLIDRDFVEWSNLQRQFLYAEFDAEEALPKAVAASRRIAQINSEVVAEPLVADLTPASIDDLLEGAQLILDGTDNFEARYLINDYAVREAIPWIYSAAVGSYGLKLAISPVPSPRAVVHDQKSAQAVAVVHDHKSAQAVAVVHDQKSPQALAVVRDQKSAQAVAVVHDQKSAQAVAVVHNQKSPQALAVVRDQEGRACFRCVYPEPPEGTQPTCETEGVLAPITATIASLACGDALKILAAGASSVSTRMTTVDIWSGEIRQTQPLARDPDCPCCAHRDFVHLNGLRRAPISLCGRNAVQIHERARPIDLAELAAKLAPLASVRHNDFAVRALVESFELTVFPDGRAIIKGTTDPAVARGVYARYIGM